MKSPTLYCKIKRIQNVRKNDSTFVLDIKMYIIASQEGMIEDDLTLRRAIFFGGVEPQLRANVWPFLLHYYDYRTTFVQRQAIMEEKHQIYEKIK